MQIRVMLAADTPASVSWRCVPSPGSSSTTSSSQRSTAPWWARSRVGTCEEVPSTTNSRLLMAPARYRTRLQWLMSVEDAGIWKPARGAYAHGCDRVGVDAADAMLVAVHPWDVDGASRAGLATCWIDRTGTPYPSYFRAPDLTATGLDDLARQLA